MGNNERDNVKEEEKDGDDLVTSESMPRLQLHSVVTMVYPGVYNTAASNNQLERKTTIRPEVYNTAASNNRQQTNNGFTHQPIATSTLATTEPTTIAIVPTTTPTTTSTTTTSTTTSTTTTKTTTSTTSTSTTTSTTST